MALHHFDVIMEMKVRFIASLSDCGPQSAAWASLESLSEIHISAPDLQAPPNINKYNHFCLSLTLLLFTLQCSPYFYTSLGVHGRFYWGPEKFNELVNWEIFVWIDCVQRWYTDFMWSFDISFSLCYITDRWSSLLCWPWFYNLCYFPYSPIVLL